MRATTNTDRPVRTTLFRAATMAAACRDAVRSAIRWNFRQPAATVETWTGVDFPYVGPRGGVVA